MPPSNATCGSLSFSSIFGWPKRKKSQSFHSKQQLGFLHKKIEETSDADEGELEKMACNKGQKVLNCLNCNVTCALVQTSPVLWGIIEKVRCQNKSYNCIEQNHAIQGFKWEDRSTQSKKSLQYKKKDCELFTSCDMSVIQLHDHDRLTASVCRRAFDHLDRIARIWKQ